MLIIWILGLQWLMEIHQHGYLQDFRRPLAKQRMTTSSQKQPSRGVLKKSCSKNIQQIYRRTPMPKCDFNKVGKQLCWIFSEHLFLRTPLGGCFCIALPWYSNEDEKNFFIWNRRQINKVQVFVKCQKVVLVCRFFL